MYPFSSSVRFSSAGAYSLDLDASAYVRTPNDGRLRRIPQELLLRLLEAIEGAGTRLAIPTQASINYGADLTHSEPGTATRE